jgi:hypothetical protein
MFIPLLITLWGTILSMPLIVGFERYACHIHGKPLATWQRWSIPLPIFLIAGSNLDGALCLKAYQNAHPGAFVFRNATTDAWHVDVLFSAGLLGMLLLPLCLSRNFKDARYVTPVVWLGFFVWLILVGVPMCLSTGVPLQD